MINLNLIINFQGGLRLDKNQFYTSRDHYRPIVPKKSTHLSVLGLFLHIPGGACRINSKFVLIGWVFLKLSGIRGSVTLN